MPRVSSTRSRTTRPPASAANGRARSAYDVRQDVVANGRPTRAARPRTFAPDDDDYLTPSPSPTAAQSPTPGSFSRSPSPAWAQVGIGRFKSYTSLPKKVPNMFMMYKNDFHRRYPEVCILERLPTQRMRIAARLWEREPPSVREHYERRYRDAMIAAGRRFAEKDMNKRKKRSMNVTSTRRAKRAAQGETLTKKSQAIIRHWHLGLRRSRLVIAIHNWESDNNWSVSSSSNVRKHQLQQMLLALGDIEGEEAETPGSPLLLDEQSAPSPSQSGLKAEESDSPWTTTATQGQFRLGSAEQEDLSRSPVNKVASPSPSAHDLSETCTTPPRQPEQAYSTPGVYAANGGNPWSRYALNGFSSSPIQSAAIQDENYRGAAVDAIAGLCHNLGCLDIKPTHHAMTPILPELPPVVEDCVMEDVPMPSADDCDYLEPVHVPLTLARTYNVPQLPAAQAESTASVAQFVTDAGPFAQQTQADYPSPSHSDVLFFETMMFDEDTGSIKSEETQVPSPSTLEYALKHEQEVPVMLYNGEDDQWSRQCEDVLWKWSYAGLIEPALLKL